MDFWGRKSYS